MNNFMKKMLSCVIILFEKEVKKNNPLKIGTWWSRVRN
jgi:hypothetical protein